MNNNTNFIVCSQVKNATERNIMKNKQKMLQIKTENMLSNLSQQAEYRNNKYG